VNVVKEAMKTENTEQIKSSIDALNNAWNEVSAKLYQQQQTAGGTGAQSGAGAGSADAGADDSKNVEEADYEVVDDDDKK
jgi:molecular chaperone DnaK